MNVIIVVVTLNLLVNGAIFMLFMSYIGESRVQHEHFKEWLWSWMLRSDQAAPFPPTQEELKKELRKEKKQKATVYDPNQDPMAEFTGRKSDYF